METELNRDLTVAENHFANLPSKILLLVLRTFTLPLVEINILNSKTQEDAFLPSLNLCITTVI